MKLKEFRLTKKDVAFYHKDGDISQGTAKQIYKLFANKKVEQLPDETLFGTYCQAFKEI